MLSVVDSASYHVDGYFEETKLGGIHIGDAVDIRVMGDNTRLRGHVQSFAAGIEDRDRSSGANLLPNVNPHSAGCAWPSVFRCASPLMKCRRTSA